MNTSLTLYQLRYQEIWGTGCVCFFGREGGGTPLRRSTNWAIRRSDESSLGILRCTICLTRHGHKESYTDFNQAPAQGQLYKFKFEKFNLRVGLEPTTSWILVWRSTNWAIRRSDESSLGILRCTFFSVCVCVYMCGCVRVPWISVWRSNHWAIRLTIRGVFIRVSGRCEGEGHSIHLGVHSCVRMLKFWITSMCLWFYIIIYLYLMLS